MVVAIVVVCFCVQILSYLCASREGICISRSLTSTSLAGDTACAERGGAAAGGRHCRMGVPKPHPGATVAWLVAQEWASVHAVGGSGS